MNLIPIHQTLEQNDSIRSRKDCPADLEEIIGFYDQIGYQEPWICYYAEVDGDLVGSCACKGAPKDNKVEIAYMTYEEFRNQGHASNMCRCLIDVAKLANPGIIITARTLMEESFSTRLLENNGFKNVGTVIDYDDGEVWEWVYQG